MSLLTTSRAGRTPDEPSPEKASGGRRAATTASAAVNLLSPWVFEELRVRRLRRRFVLGAVALLVTMAAVWGLLRLDLARGEQDLRDDEAVGDGLRGQIDDLGDVKRYVADVRLRVARVEETMSAQIGLARVMRELDAAMPAGATLTALQVSLPIDPATSDQPAAAEVALCPGADPFGARAVVACIELGGTADSRADISALVQALDGSDLFVEPFVSDTTRDDEDGGKVTFAGTLGLDAATYTDRFADIDGSDEPDADEAATTKPKKRGSR